MRQEHSDLRRTRASLFYLVFYLFPLSVGLLISPTGTFHFLGFAGRTCNCGVEIVWRVAAGAGDGGGTLDSKTSIGGLHQYRHRALGIRSPFT